MSELPTGTVTLLLADVEGSTRLWETQPEAMKAAVERLDQTLSQVVVAHGGVRPVEQGEGDSFVIAFARAVDAVGCALDLQRAPLAPIKLRIGLHTGDIHLRDEGNYIGPTINRTARLRDLAHGGQTVLSGATEPLVVDQLPPDVTLTDLGSHPLRDLPRPERVVQLCHPDLHNEFPPLRTANVLAAAHLPVQLTSFIGRQAEMRGIREALADNRLVTLTGAGGAGKTRLAVHIAANIATEFADGAWYVDLAPITDPDLIPITVARALNLPDQPGQQPMDMLLRFIRDRRMLLLLDNCEHLLDASAELVISLSRACPALTLLTTSREPLGVAGEVSWRVPSLSLADEAIELFGDRARRTKPEFRVTPANSDTVTEICRRLDGLPLAIELAAARVRAMAPTEILDSLRDTFRLLTGGARTAVRRQQTLRASVDWSHEMLSDAEQLLFRRLSVCYGGFDLDAAHAVASAGEVERYQILDQLTLLVDKSLLVAEETRQGTRYRLLETVRQYAQEKLSDSREGDEIRARHCDHYLAVARRLDAPNSHDDSRIEQVEAEIDNLRAAFAWSMDGARPDLAQEIAAALLPLWLTRRRMQEGLDWLDAALADESSDDAERAVARIGASVARAALLGFTGLAVKLDAEQILVAAREVGDPVLVTRALTACGSFANEDLEKGDAYFAEAADLARSIGDSWWLGQILFLKASFAVLFSELAVAEAAAEEGLHVADGIGAGALSRQFRYVFGWTRILRGDLADALARLDELDEELTATHDGLFFVHVPACRAMTLTYQGHTEQARRIAERALERCPDSYYAHLATVHTAFGYVHLADGDGPAARAAFEAGREITGLYSQLASLYIWAPLAVLACGDLGAARRWADELVSATTAWCLAAALTSRARVASAQGELDTAERDARKALDLAVSLGGELLVPFALDCLAITASDAGHNVVAVRLFASAEAARTRMGMVRFKVLETGDRAKIEALRDNLGDNDFDAAWAEGAALSIEEATAYALRGRGERNRADSGWASLTRAELGVARLVSEGLGNKDVAARLFVSPRTVQAHLTHIYNKLGLTSRVQLAQEAAKHA